ncbi:acetylornithine deacetylase [Candidatus Ishikawella capsulata]|uniref:acetylornithine deacetylase n=1 Tax=Candidatus Ishikawella capsulata TaxID=168169 RepID=UPI0005971834|nr:acetylornithine deacetylase [Candidatus Ishikawaella capsulata]
MTKKLPTFIDLYSQLIATPSISSNNPLIDQSNEDIIHLLCEWFEHIGFKVETTFVNNINNNIKLNMLASIGNGEGGLLLTGHTDTIPADIEKWTYNPFILTEKNNKLYGLGSVDMKCFFAFILNAVRNLNPLKLKKPLYILATAEEETSMAGAKQFSEYTTIYPDYAIIGEPSCLKPIRAHKGHISKAIHIQGQSAHSSNPFKGINAIEIVYEIIDYLLKLRNDLRENYQNNLFNIPYPTINFGYIHGGHASNCICGYCELHIDIRPTSDITIMEINNLINNVLTYVNPCWSKRISISELHPYIPAYECSSYHEIVKFLERITGTKACSVDYCTEASFIQKICPTLIIGPGSIEQAHQKDEFLDMVFIKPTHNLIKKLIHYFCY